MAKTSKEVAAAAVVAVATSVAAASVIVGLRCFAAKFEILAIVVVSFVTCFVAITVMKIVAIEFVAAAAAEKDLLVADLSVAEIVSLVVRMSLSIHSCHRIGNFVASRVTVAEVESMLLVAAHIDLKSG